MFLAATQVNVSQSSLEAHLLNLSQSFQDISDTQSQLNDILARTASLVSTAYTIIDQVREKKVSYVTVTIINKDNS